MFVEKSFIKFLDNNSKILLDAPHAQPPEREFYIDEIAEKWQQKIVLTV